MQINYGASHPNSMVNGRKHNYDYLGQERQEELGLNWLTFRYRNYIPEIGRFFGIDPISEDYMSISTYQFAHNNPVWKIELEGLEGTPANGAKDVINEEPNQGLHVRFRTGIGATIGVKTNILGIPLEAVYDGGTKTGEIDVLTGDGALEKTSGYSIKTPVIGYGKETAIDVSNVSPDKENTYVTPEQTVESNKRTTEEFSFMFGTVVLEDHQSGTVSVPKKHTTSGGKVTIPSDTGAVLSGETTFNPTSSEKTDASHGKIVLFGAEINTGLRLGIEIEYTPPKQNDTKKAAHEYITTCFVAGTKVLMADGQEKNIEDIKAGDLIMSVDITSMKIEEDEVLMIPNRIKKYKKIIAKFNNGVISEFSPAHPFFVKDKGWAVFDTNEAKRELNFKVKKLEKYDIVYYYDNNKLKEAVLTEIKDSGEHIEMYNVEYVKKNHTFFANKILVHNKFVSKEN